MPFLSNTKVIHNTGKERRGVNFRFKRVSCAYTRYDDRYISGRKCHTWKTNTNNGISVGWLVDGDNENWFHPSRLTPPAWHGDAPFERVDVHGTLRKTSDTPLSHRHTPTRSRYLHVSGRTLIQLTQKLIQFRWRGNYFDCRIRLNNSYIYIYIWNHCKSIVIIYGNNSAIKKSANQCPKSW